MFYKLYLSGLLNGKRPLLTGVSGQRERERERGGGRLLNILVLLQIITVIVASLTGLEDYSREPKIGWTGGISVFLSVYFQLIP